MLFSQLNRQISRYKIRSGDSCVLIKSEVLDEILAIALNSVKVDEQWYLERYQDVKAAIAAGSVKTAKQHFVKYGYFEGRLPRPIEVDEVFYLREYPDVRAAIESGEIPDATTHFHTAGAREGRIPYHGFSLFD
ncbi:hypothetical protein [Methylobacterium nodulans]|uniref:Uncharacterized protein n=1 Tax=Methylobacterium nodulans (strain LMG 21967 / CNCM I-2342 / ORS 2060) TaxID=460265 RepID=B8IFG2_METNO|nr:hypothetical protein [Methylobacterium nodulans]ACL57697.1 hypothetical protein Mnod_2744 [Methylobacterium nodulans ORS 2060]